MTTYTNKIISVHIYSNMQVVEQVKKLFPIIEIRMI